MDNCKICGRPLSTPTSLLTGIGPICRSKRRIQEYKNNLPNIFSNRAAYSWGIKDEILWLSGDDNDGRSLTNDIENCLIEISEQLPKKKALTDYKIIYRDVLQIWDAIEILKINDLTKDLKMIKKSNQTGGTYWSKSLQINFFPVNSIGFDEAIKKVNQSKSYGHLKSKAKQK